MINPNICRLVTVMVIDNDTCYYDGRKFRIDNRTNKPLLPGKRKLSLRFSICTDEYYMVKEDRIYMTKSMRAS